MGSIRIQIVKLTFKCYNFEQKKIQIKSIQRQKMG